MGVGRATVNSWLAPAGKSSHKAMPDTMVRLLKAVLRAKHLPVSVDEKEAA